MKTVYSSFEIKVRKQVFTCFLFLDDNTGGENMKNLNRKAKEDYFELLAKVEEVNRKLNKPRLTVLIA